MTKPKTLEQLRTEKERAETQLAQEQHKLERLENRKKYLEKGERTKRTHRLCNLGGTIESLAPEVKDLTRSNLCCSCASCVSARSFSARSWSRVFGFVIVIDLLFLIFGIKKDRQLFAHCDQSTV